jgi:hypothetical protein
LVANADGVAETQLRELDPKSLPYVPLPRAPLRWEARSGGPENPPEAEDSFEVHDAKWRLTAVELARLAFVSPMVAEAVAAGRAPAGINLQMLMDGRLALAPDWKDQQLLLQR